MLEAILEFIWSLIKWLGMAWLVLTAIAYVCQMYAFPHRWKCQLCNLEVKTNSQEAMLRVMASHRHEKIE